MLAITIANTQQLGFVAFGSGLAAGAALVTIIRRNGSRRNGR